MSERPLLHYEYTRRLHVRLEPHLSHHHWLNLDIQEGAMWCQFTPSYLPPSLHTGKHTKTFTPKDPDQYFRLTPGSPADPSGVRCCGADEGTVWVSGCDAVVRSVATQTYTRLWHTCTCVHYITAKLLLDICLFYSSESDPLPEDVK